MERSDRAPILHKLRDNVALPVPPEMSREVEKKVAEYFQTTPPKSRSRFDRLLDVYGLADLIMTDVNPLLVCRRGCAHCCRVPVELTTLEAGLIAWKTGVSAAKNPPPHEPPHDTRRDLGYCPFLNQETAECGIYPWRPYNCRVFGALDSPDYCIDPQTKHYVFGAAHWGYGSAPLLHGAIEIMRLDAQRNLAGDALLKYARTRLRDIRDFFGEDALEVVNATTDLVEG